MEEIVPLLTRERSDRVALVAEEQRSGRGRRGNEWESLRGGLWLSLTIAMDPVDPFVGILAAEAARATVDSLTPHRSGLSRPTLKWPNDLIIGSKKWGGVVAEQKTVGQPVAIIGIGLNLDFSFTADTRPPEATTVREHLGDSPRPEEVLEPLLKNIDQRCALDRADRAESVRQVSKHLSTLGQPISWREGTATGRGTALALDRSGALRVRDELGRERLLHAAEVRHLRTT